MLPLEQRCSAAHAVGAGAREVQIGDVRQRRELAVQRVAREVADEDRLGDRQRRPRGTRGVDAVRDGSRELRLVPGVRWTVGREDVGERHADGNVSFRSPAQLANEARTSTLRTTEGRRRERS